MARLTCVGCCPDIILLCSLGVSPTCLCGADVGYVFWPIYLQEHFYLETQTSLLVPGEKDEMTVYSSTQVRTSSEPIDVIASTHVSC